MGKSKVGRADLLRMEADLADAEAAFVALKAKRRTCDGCGRPVRQRDMTKKDRELDSQIRQAATDLRAQRKAFREAQGR